MLKGHTTIELTDVNTGEKEIHEDDNIITNAINKLLGYTGVFCNNGALSAFNTPSREYSSEYSALKRLTGGLLLFDSEIEENKETIYPPSGTLLVGCGSGISYNGANTMAGSYNKSESGKVDNGYKHVWDFGTSQANGKIACACLTTRAGGKITPGSFPLSSDYMYNVGSSADVYDETTFSSQSVDVFLTKCENETSNSYDGSGSSILFIDGLKNRILRAKSSFWSYNVNSNSDGTKFKQSIFYRRAIDIVVQRLGVSTFSIIDDALSSVLADKMPYNFNAIEEVTVEMPDGLKAIITDDMLSVSAGYKYFSCCMTYDNNNIYIAMKLNPSTDTGSHAAQIIGKNEKLYVWKINAYTFESAYFEVTNTTGEEIAFMNRYNSGLASVENRQYVCMYDDYLLCCGYTSKKVYCIDLKDNTNVSEIKYPDGSSFLVNNSNWLGTTLYQGGKVLVNKDGVSSYESSVFRVVDIATKICTYKNTYLRYFYGTTYVRNLYNVAGTHLFCSSIMTSSEFYLRLFIDPTLLVTINNLTSPVLKTESQTMKVTYTLTQVDDTQEGGE